MVTGIVAGVFGTIVMDSFNNLFARIGILSKIDMSILGRMSSGWTRGRFLYSNPEEMKQVPNETFYGYITHYTVGIVLAVTYVLAWDLLVGEPLSPIWTLVYGISTTVASLFLVLPSMGFGVLGRRSPEGIRSPLSSLANHLFFGLGMAAAVVLV